MSSEFASPLGEMATCVIRVEHSLTIPSPTSWEMRQPGGGHLFIMSGVTNARILLCEGPFSSILAANLYEQKYECGIAWPSNLGLWDFFASENLRPGYRVLVPSIPLECGPPLPKRP